MNEPKQRNGFHIENEERSVSPEKLNECIRVGSTGGFLLVAALIIAAAALIVWGFVGSIPVTVTEQVVIAGSTDASDICVGFVDISKDTGILPEGAEVNIQMPDRNYVKGSVMFMTPEPLSSEEIRELFRPDSDVVTHLTDWIYNVLLGDSLYSYVIIIQTEEDVSAYWHQVADASFIVGEVSPISLLTR